MVETTLCGLGISMLGIFTNICECHNLTRMSFVSLTNCKNLLKYAYFTKLFGYHFRTNTHIHRSNKQVIIVSLMA